MRGEIGIICRGRGKHEVAFFSRERHESVADHFEVDFLVGTGIKVKCLRAISGACESYTRNDQDSMMSTIEDEPDRI